jgi:hypothetical protein
MSKNTTYAVEYSSIQMKTTRLLLLFISIILSLSIRASRGERIFISPLPDTTLCLEIEGKVLNSDQDGSDCKVELLLGENVVDSIILKGKRRKFSFQFKKNEHYTIRISKPGFTSKSVCVHTNMQEPAEDLLYEFYFETT